MGLPLCLFAEGINKQLNKSRPVMGVSARFEEKIPNFWKDSLFISY